MPSNSLLRELSDRVGHLVTHSRKPLTFTAEYSAVIACACELEVLLGKHEVEGDDGRPAATFHAVLGTDERRRHVIRRTGRHSQLDTVWS